MKEAKILCNYICNQLVKSKPNDEMHQIKKMINEVLELMINRLVLDQVQE